MGLGVLLGFALMCLRVHSETAFISRALRLVTKVSRGAPSALSFSYKGDSRPDAYAQQLRALHLPLQLLHLQPGGAGLRHVGHHQRALRLHVRQHLRQVPILQRGEHVLRLHLEAGGHAGRHGAMELTDQ